MTSPCLSSANQQRAADLCRKLSPEQKAGFLAGVDDWHFRGLPEEGVPSMLVADCGHGVTLCGVRTSPATCFPTGIGMAATWNPALMEAVGRVIGEECLALGVSLLLGPKINLHRHPLNGRSFETFSEDPVLAGRLGGALVRGIQSTGVGACIKALAANNQQYQQQDTNVVVDETTLRELYLRNFEIAIQEGRPCAAMTSYNPLNGQNTGESTWLVQQVIKEQWGFEGLVVSDWRAIRTEAVYQSGLDLEMPGPGKFHNVPAVLDALESGKLSQEALDDKVRRILAVALQFGRDENQCAEFAHLLDAPEHREVARRVAEESVVLLKNQNALLPLDPQAGQRIAVIGPNAASIRLGGGGSASVTPTHTVSILEGIQRRLPAGASLHFEEGCGLVGSMEVINEHLRHPTDSGSTAPGLKATFFNHPEIEGKPADASWIVPQVDFSWGWAAPGPGVTRYAYAVRFEGQLCPTVSGQHRLGVFGQEGVIRLWVDGQLLVNQWPTNDDNFEETYSNHYETVTLDLQADQPVNIRLEYGKRAARAAVRLEWEQPGVESGIDRAVRAARDADVAIVCAGLSNLFEGGSKDRSTTDLPETQVKLIEAVAAANPRTVVILQNGGPLTMPWEPNVAALLEAWYPGQEGGEAIAGILFGEVNPSGKLPDTLAHRMEDHAALANYPGQNHQVEYQEGLFIGYRHFDTRDIEPHYPFGFGLSYTTFSLSPPSLSQSTLGPKEELQVTVTVQNQGTRAGYETVQLYLGRVDDQRPPKALHAFQKIWLEPGQSQPVHFHLTASDFAIWDPNSGAWATPPGEAQVLTGTHSRDLQGASINLT